MNPTILLRPTLKDDLNVFFQFQLDEEANYLAAFTAKDPNDKVAYIEKYSAFLTDPAFTNRTIILNGEIAGVVSKYIMWEEAQVTYWIDKKLWGKGIASAALKEFLKSEKVRPIFGRVAFDNFGSQKVLENCGFIRSGTDKGFANARQTEIEEFIYKLAD